MKKIHILGIAVIAAAIFIIVSVAGDASSYVTFNQAKAMFENGNLKKIHVVGELPKDEKEEVTGIMRGEDLVSFSFLMTDANNETLRVYYNEPMPPDFQKSEQVVVIGNFQNDRFVADQILLKCPSKYQEETLQVSGIKIID
ncbi:MAG: cytochrome c maturation protein CcmE [Cyclobacteriaceae bacterium]